MRNSMSIGRLMGAVGVLTCLPATVVADGSWFENFDSYALGSGLHGQGGWKGWDNDATWDAFVSDTFALSDPHSVGPEARPYRADPRRGCRPMMQC